MRALSQSQANNCESAQHPACKCRCGGMFHGANRQNGTILPEPQAEEAEEVRPSPDQTIPRDFFEQLSPDDPHHLPDQIEQMVRRRLRDRLRREERKRERLERIGRPVFGEPIPRLSEARYG